MDRCGASVVALAAALSLVAQATAAQVTAIGGKGKVYINSTNPNVSSVEGREMGFAEVMKAEYLSLIHI